MNSIIEKSEIDCFNDVCDKIECLADFYEGDVFAALDDLVEVLLGPGFHVGGALDPEAVEEEEQSDQKLSEVSET